MEIKWNYIDGRGTTYQLLCLALFCTLPHWRNTIFSWMDNIQEESNGSSLAILPKLSLNMLMAWGEFVYEPVMEPRLWLKICYIKIRVSCINFKYIFHFSTPCFLLVTSFLVGKVYSSCRQSDKPRDSSGFSEWISHPRCCLASQMKKVQD